MPGSSYPPLALAQLSKLLANQENYWCAGETMEAMEIETMEAMVRFASLMGTVCRRSAQVASEEAENQKYDW
jgi:hypothetical protein